MTIFDRSIPYTQAATSFDSFSDVTCTGLVADAVNVEDEARRGTLTRRLKTFVRETIVWCPDDVTQPDGAGGFKYKIPVRCMVRNSVTHYDQWSVVGVVEGYLYSEKVDLTDDVIECATDQLRGHLLNSSWVTVHLLLAGKWMAQGMDGSGLDILAPAPGRDVLRDMLRVKAWSQHVERLLLEDEREVRPFLRTELRRLGPFFTAAKREDDEEELWEGGIKFAGLLNSLARQRVGAEALPRDRTFRLATAYNRLLNDRRLSGYGVERLDCGHWVMVDDEENRHGVGGRSRSREVCRSCFEDDFVYVEDRGEYWHRDNAHYHEYDDCYYSYEEDRDDSDGDDSDGPIYGYHSGPRVGRIGNAKADSAGLPVWLGLELEVERKRGCSTDRHELAQEALDLLNDDPEDYCVCEDDGSLSYGFEIITGYGTLAEHEARLEKLKSLPFNGKLVSHNATTCGLHVHVSRAGMTPLHAAKLQMFVHSTDNAELMKAVARRFGSSYARFVPDNYIATVARQFRGYVDMGWTKKNAWGRMKPSMLGCADRYNAVNFDNGDTVEFRLFKGTLRFESIMACLEFTRMCWYFSRDVAISALNVEGFLRYISRPEHRQDTRYLRPYLSEKGFAVFKARPAPQAEAVSTTEEANASC